MDQFAKTVAILLVVVASSSASFAYDHSLAGQSASGLSAKKADYILVEKNLRIMTLFHGYRAIKTYRISLGKNPEGPKQFEGDESTPEGHYRIVAKNSHSQFYKSLKISYPNKQDIQRAKEVKKSPGGNIMIHAFPREWDWIGRMHLLLNWTDGCIAVTPDEMDEIWNLVGVGTPITIVPQF